MSCSFSDAGRAASAFSAASILAFKSSGRADVFPSVTGEAPTSVMLASSLFLNFFSTASFFSDFSLSSVNSASKSFAVISPDSIDFDNPSLSINSLAAFLAASLSGMFESLAIASSN